MPQLGSDRTGSLVISVVIPLYNKRDHIERCIDSVLCQTAPSDDIIVVDDGSTDGGAELLESYQRTGLRLVRQVNAGVSAARNAGVQVARYAVVAFLDADDWWYPNHLAQIRDLVERFPDAVLYSTTHATRQFGVVRRHVNRRIPRLWSGLVYRFIRDFSRYRKIVHSSTAAVRVRALCEIGGFPVGVRVGEDVIVWCKLALSGAVAHAEVETAVQDLDATNRSNVGTQLHIPASIQFLADCISAQPAGETRRDLTSLFRSIAVSTLVGYRIDGRHGGGHALMAIALRCRQFGTFVMLVSVSLIPVPLLVMLRNRQYRSARHA